jgi:hypothetical protein
VLRTAFYFIPSAMTGFIVSVFPFRNRVSPKEAFEGLELGEGKPSRPVLRGPGGRKAAWLLGSNADVADGGIRKVRARTRFAGSVLPRKLSRLSFRAIGARIMIAFAPFFTKRPSCFQVLNPATSVASGLCEAINMTLCQLNVDCRTMLIGERNRKWRASLRSRVNIVRAISRPLAICEMNPRLVEACLPAIFSNTRLSGK